MRVVRKERAVFAAHQLPEHLDDATRQFAAANNLAISELPGDGPARFSIFNLRWTIHTGHSYANPGDWVVMEEGCQVLSPEAYAEAYIPEEQA